MLQYPLQATRAGVYGRVVSTRGVATGATITASTGGLPFRADVATGAFYRALAPGEHTLTFHGDSGHGGGGIGDTAVRTVIVPADGSGVELVVDLDAADAAAGQADGAADAAAAHARWAGLPRHKAVHEEPHVFPYAIVAGRGAPHDSLAHEARGTAVTAATQGAVAAQAEAERLAEQTKWQATGSGEAAGGSDTKRVSLWVAGRWALFLGGVVWLGYQASVWRSGRWPGGQHGHHRMASARGPSRRHGVLPA